MHIVTTMQNVKTKRSVIVMCCFRLRKVYIEMIGNENVVGAYVTAAIVANTN